MFNSLISCYSHDCAAYLTSLFMCIAADRTLRTVDLTFKLIPFLYIIALQIAYHEVAVSPNIHAMNLKVKRAL